MLFVIAMLFVFKANAQDAKMKIFIDGLMKKMTLKKRSAS